MTEMDMREAQSRFFELLSLVEKGEKTVIINRGTPVAEFVLPARIRQAEEAIAAIKARIKLTGINQDQFNEMRLRGRR